MNAVSREGKSLNPHLMKFSPKKGLKDFVSVYYVWLRNVVMIEIDENM